MSRARFVVCAALLLSICPHAPAAAPPPILPGGYPSATFTVDAELAGRLAEAAQLVKKEAWPEAIRALRAILDGRDRLFPAPDDERRPTTWIGSHAAALRLIAALPAEQQTKFQQLSEPAAREALRAARAKEDRSLYLEVFARFPGTDAAGEAASLLATQAADHGDYGVSAGWFRIVLARPQWAEKLSTVALYQATIAASLAGNAEDAARSLKRLTDKAGDEKTVRIEGRLLRIDELKKEVARVAARADGLGDWPVYRGDPSRSLPALGRTPLLKPNWTVSTLPDKKDHRAWIEDYLTKATAALEKRELPILPGFHPIATDSKLIFRNYDGFFLVLLREPNPDFRNMWQTSDGGSQGVLGDPNKKQGMDGWKNDYLRFGPDGVLFENSLNGTLATDGTRVLMIDDLMLPPNQANAFRNFGAGVRPNYGHLNDQAYRNSLKAYNIDSFKLVWDIGGRMASGNFELDKVLGILDDNGKPADQLLDDNGKPIPGARPSAFFLGPPLPLGGEIYTLHEKGNELRLICLAPRDRTGDRVPQPPSLVWSKPLMTIRDRLDVDPIRRIHAVHLAHADGILVCPTNAGVVVGVEVLTRRVAWVHRYALRRRSLVADLKPLVNEWKMTAPAIHQGKVIYAAPDSPVLSCLDLRDGKPLWQVEREDDDCYFAGICDGKALIVGTKSVRAVDVGTGREVWKLDTGMPSGQGIVAGKVYYLPVKASLKNKQPGICAIDVAAGRVQAHIVAAKTEEGVLVPGNLIFYQDQLISQTVSGVTSYPLVKE